MNDRIRRVLADVLDLPIATIDEQASPKSLEAWDSLRQMSLIVALEAEFGVLFDDSVVTTLSSFAAIRSELERALPSAA